ncbi:methylated-DNA--[protein]-cysteine S-methyltransferase [Kutzneria viridogrisea]|uniref:methylated-DNA--[protein]-cysteine S-methyltransferase n=2 Tax=Kutzneria TaxID=43356 RepID=W5WD17_9PSEU|nr:methylated-DNA--[protein]-cysteine S-methyltransferase [Kutzneria albida]AHH96104.1 hypothetical protein KALB_2736 [Kutzneria albida DSM 43870]MBA8928690.1 methylated-DNA-[protein]-cysteine S-methyltransferase [Kutzneria viridogrisea]
MTAPLLTFDTTVGPLTIGASDTGLTVCSFDSAEEVAGRYPLEPATGAAPQWLELAREEIGAYLDGALREFTVPADLRYAHLGDRRILAGLDSVRYGQTTTYGRLAESLGLPPTAARAVGRAMALNPVLIVVPCHRVLGAGGALIGYAGGLTVKRRLLDVEAVDRTPQLDLFWNS